MGVWQWKVEVRSSKVFLDMKSLRGSDAFRLALKRQQIFFAFGGVCGISLAGE
jgi:hypothetical protein